MQPAVSKLIEASFLPAAVGAAAKSNSRIREFEIRVNFLEDQEFEIRVKCRTPPNSPLAGNLKIPK